MLLRHVTMMQMIDTGLQRGRFINIYDNIVGGFEPLLPTQLSRQNSIHGTIIEAIPNSDALTLNVRGTVHYQQAIDKFSSPGFQQQWHNKQTIRE
jgi:hypothetical protein